MKLKYNIIPIHKDQTQNILDLILPIQQIEFNVPVTLDGQQDLLDIDTHYHQTGGGFWGAFINHELVGTIALISIGHHSGAIRKMFVKKEFRGKEIGVAQSLLEKLIRYCKNNNITDLYLGTVNMLKAAHRFYERNEFISLKNEQLPTYFPRMMGEDVYYHLRLPDPAQVR